MISIKNVGPPPRRPLIATIVGDGGMGKTTLGSLMPGAVFLPLEDGLASIRDTGCATFPILKTSVELHEALRSLLNDDHPYKTLVIDSISQLDAMLTQEIISGDPKAEGSLVRAKGGYGAGAEVLMTRHQEIRSLCGQIANKRGLHVLFLGHAIVESIDSPDMASFNRYTLRINKKSASAYTDDVDLVGFLKLKTYVSDGKATSTNERVLACYPTPSHISKNRFGITADIPYVLGQNPLEPVLKMLGQQKTNQDPTDQFESTIKFSFGGKK